MGQGSSIETETNSFASAGTAVWSHIFDAVAQMSSAWYETIGSGKWFPETFVGSQSCVVVNPACTGR